MYVEVVPIYSVCISNLVFILYIYEDLATLPIRQSHIFKHLFSGTHQSYCLKIIVKAI